MNDDLEDHREMSSDPSSVLCTEYGFHGLRSQ